MSSIPVRRTTRVARPTKDNENANARRPSSRVTTRSAKPAALSGVAGGTVAPAVTTRATAATAASKAKSITTTTSTEGATKETAGAKRKREVLVEVTTLVTNNNKHGGSGATKGKESEKEKATSTLHGAGAKTKTSVKPPSSRKALIGISKRVVRAGSESTTVSTKTEESTTTFEIKSTTSYGSTVEQGDEKMEVDEPHVHLTKVEEELPTTTPKDDEEEAGRVFKRRHTEEKSAATQVEDKSQVEADKVAAELEPIGSSSSIQLWEDLDEEDWDDPVMVSEYVVDVCIYLKEIELSTLPRADYMDSQPEINWEHRGVLVDWLLQVHAKFGLLQESLFLTVNLLDRFLGLRTISLSKLQLVGLACFFIATKYEETYAPSVKEIAFLADDQYTVEEILKAERYILRTVEWDLKAPGPMGWLRRGSKADDCEVHARTIAKYLIEISCLERRLIGIVPSLVSAAALWLARLTLGREIWTPNLEHYTTYSEKELLPTATIMLEYVITEPVPHESLYKKYAHKRYRRCSTFIRQWCLDRWPENSDIKLAKDLPVVKAEIRQYRALVEAEVEAEMNGERTTGGDVDEAGQS